MHVFRRFLIAAGLAASLFAEADEPDSRFRYGTEAIDALFRRAKAAYIAKHLDRREFRAVLELLRLEELEIAGQAKTHRFQDLREANYWHRGRLKFPTTIQTELRNVKQ